MRKYRVRIDLRATFIRDVMAESDEDAISVADQDLSWFISDIPYDVMHAEAEPVED